MNLRDLEYFIAVAHHKHFRKAAEACFVSQPTLSGQIKKLEEELGVVLIDRKSKSLILSKAGELLLTQAQKIILESNHLVQMAQNFKSPLEGTLKVGFIPTVGPYVIPLIIESLKKALPQISLEFVELKTNEIIDSLNQNDVDVGLLALPIGEPNLSEIPLFNESFYITHSIKSQLLNKSPNEIIQSEKLYLLEDGHCFRNQVLNICSNSTNTSPFNASSLETINMMIQATGGITLVPELTMLEWKKKENNNVFVAFDGVKPARSIGLIHRELSTRIECINLFAQVILKVITPLLEDYKKEIIEPL